MATIRDEIDLIEARTWALNVHSDWKRRMKTSDLIAGGHWSTVWPDLTGAPSDPLVENVYIEALEDKANSAAGVVPALFVAPSTGTRADRGETQAQEKRKVFVSYMQRSREEKLRIKWFLDWFQHGAAYSMPWADWASAGRFPFFIRHDPRFAYPLAHDTLGRLTSIFFSKQRRVIDLEQEWGYDHPALVELKRFRASNDIDENEDVEELWFADNDKWGVGIYHSQRHDMGFRYRDPTLMPNVDGHVYFLAPPEPHRMMHCPVVESKRETFDGEYRGPLEVMTPQIQVAHNIMARILEDMELQLGAPVILDNIENWEEFGAYAHLRGDGQGPANVEYARPPSNFEATQQVQLQIESARQAGKYPQQRGGEPGASISSAKGTNVLMGAFNSELAVAQMDMANFYQDTLAGTAEFDVQWCNREKKVIGFDQGEDYNITYVPGELFRNDDYRVMVSYGGGAGLDRQQHLIQLALMRNSGAMSTRTFMQQSGLIDNVLQEERDQALDVVSQGFFAFAMQQAQAGNVQPIQDFVNRIDDDDETTRAAIMETIKTMFAQPAPTPGGGGGGSPADALLEARSLEQGGIPGQAAGLPAPPAVGEGLQRALPGSAGRLANQIAPGGNA